jgi:amino acid transporter
MVTAVAVALTISIGMTDFNAEYLSLPPKAFGTSASTFVMSLGTACRFGLYDFTGYYDACQMAGEVEEPRKNIPRATVITCVLVAVIYFLVYISVMGYLPWSGPDGFVQLVKGESNSACYIMSIFTEKACGVWCARAFTLVVMLTIFGANFAMMCGCAYLPYAAALEGHFFAPLKHRHPDRPDVADYSLLLIGGISFCFCFVPLETLVEAMMTLMLIVQFLGNSVGLLIFHYVRKERQRRRIPWRVPLFPLPCILQLLTFGFILSTTPSYLARGERPTLEFALAFLVFGIGSYLVWARRQRIWPFCAKSVSRHCSLDSICANPPGSDCPRDRE